MVFGKIFSQSWKDYKTNFRVIFKLVFIFIGILSIINAIIALGFMYYLPGYTQTLEENSLAESPSLFMIGLLGTLGILGFMLGILALIAFLFVQGSIFKISIKKNKFTFKEAVRAGKSFFWKYIGITIILGIFMAGLFIYLLIPMIIFMIYWAFSIYILAERKETGIFNSLKESLNLVRGKWWKVFGYSVVIFILCSLVYIAGWVISSPLQNAYVYSILQGKPSFLLALSSVAFGTFLNFAVNLIIYPFIILFFKNFYFHMKSGKKKTKKETWFGKYGTNIGIILAIIGLILWSLLIAFTIALSPIIFSENTNQSSTLDELNSIETGYYRSYNISVKETSKLTIKFLSDANTNVYLLDQEEFYNYNNGEDFYYLKGQEAAHNWNIEDYLIESGDYQFIIEAPELTVHYNISISLTHL